MVGSLSRDPSTRSASAVSMRSRTVRGLPKPVMPRNSGWSLGMTSPRRQLAMTGTCRSSAKRTRSLEHRARRTPAPARMTGRSAEARKLSTARRSPADGASGCGRTTGARVPSGSARSWTSSGIAMSAGPGRPSTAARTAASRVAAAVSASPISPAHLARPPIVLTRSISWNASRPRRPRSTPPTMTNIGVESAVAVWMPMARFAAPTARVPRHAAGRPVSWP